MSLWLVLVALVGTAAAQSAPDAEPELRLRLAARAARQYERIEFRIETPRRYAQPFDPACVALSLRLRHATGRSFEVPAFYAQEYTREISGAQPPPPGWCYPVGEPVWKARFAPLEPGQYEAVAHLRDARGVISSAPVSFEAESGVRPGFIRVSRRDPRFLEFTEGRPFFALGQNLAFIGPQQYVTPAKVESLFRNLADHGTNYLRIWTGCEDWALAIEARKSAWGRSWDWHPPFAPVPDDASGGLVCVRIPASSSRLEVAPSHPVAIRPHTRYRLRGEARAPVDTQLFLELRQNKIPLTTPDRSNTWETFHHEFTTGPDDYWLGVMRLTLAGAGPAYLRSISLQEAQGGSELLGEAELNRPERGYYHPLDSHWLDEIVAAAERHGLYLQLCLLTRDLYRSALKDPDSEAYAQAIRSARNFLRYAVARWGASPSVAAWEYFNEMDPGLPTDHFYLALGEYLEQIDGYGHLRTTSAWGPSPKDWRHPKLDLADAHFYLRPSDRPRLSHEVEAVLERMRILREHAPRKPAHLGEFGLADDRWRITPELNRSPDLSDVRHAWWASALSGASGTALAWWWERLDRHRVYPQYRPLADFLREVPWNSGELQTVSASISPETMRVVGLQSQTRAWLWLFDPRAAWEEVAVHQRPAPEVSDAVLRLNGVPASIQRVRWWDTRRGVVLDESPVAPTAGPLTLRVPVFRGDLAGQLGP